ncbi:regulatory LuxR family protein [Jatrophihabitans sp. GAS493]|nr:regulatory LuxR family protein [Jatrophihabitans sp. GAS493]
MGSVTALPRPDAARATLEKQYTLSEVDGTIADMARPLTPLVGRNDELATMQSLLQESVSDSARAMLVVGDAGVGKTRLLIEASAQAADRGWLRMVGHCIDFGDAGLPYLPISEAFGALVRDHPELVESLVAEFPPLARLLPAHRRLVQQTAAFDDRVERGALFDAVLGALESISAQQPVLLIVEDVHWADQATRDLLGFLFARLRGERGIAIIASYRSEDLHRRHPLRAVAAEWARLPGVTRLPLPPLTAEEIRTLIGDVRPVPLPEQVIERIIQRSGGNAFFAEQLLAAATDDDRSSSVPAELADLLLVRLDRLSADARLAVRAAAVAGRRVPHELLAAVVELPPDALEAALREAVDAHLLEPRGSEAYGFRHALLAEAVYADLLPGERVRLHASYALALTRTATGSAAELSRHAHESHDLPMAFSASVRAGDEAMTVAAAEDAMRYYENALELAAHAPPETEFPASTVAAKAANAASVAGHVFRAVALGKQAVADLPADAPPQLRAELLLGKARYAMPVDSETDALESTDEALRLVPDDPPTALRARIAVVHARCLMMLGRYADASRWGQEALMLGTRVADPEAVAEASTTLAVLDQRTGDPVSAAEGLLAVRAEARERGNLIAELRSTYSLGGLYFELGELEKAVEAYEANAARAQQAGRPWSSYAIESRVLSVLTRYQMGDWDRSAAHASVVGESPSPLAEAMIKAAGLAVAAGRGEVAALELLPALRSWSLRETMVAVQTVPAADLFVCAGEPERALEHLDWLVLELTGLWQTALIPSQVRISAIALATLSAMVSDRPQSGRPALVERGEAYLSAAWAVLADQQKPERKLGAESRAWGLRVEAEWLRLRWLAGVQAPTLDEQIEGWQRSIEGFSYGDRYEVARSQARLATVFRAAGRSAEAAELATSARETARELGAAPLLAELRALGTSRRVEAPTTGRPQNLTGREKEVLALLEQGRTNRQAAKELYISEKTVSVHVSNILAKLGASSRAEAASIARRDGLT